MAKITSKAGREILEDVERIIINAKLIYKNGYPANFETLKTQYKATLAKKQASDSSLKLLTEATNKLKTLEQGKDIALKNLKKLDEPGNPSNSKTNETSKKPVTNSALYKNEQPREHYEPPTRPDLLRAIARYEELMSDAVRNIEKLRTENKPIDDDYKDSTDKLKTELVKLIGEDSASALRALFEPVSTRQKVMEQASNTALQAKWATLDGHSSSARGKKRRQTRQRKQTRQTRQRKHTRQRKRR